MSVSLKKLVQAGLGCVLEVGVVEHLIGGLAGAAAQRAVRVLHDHFTLGAAEIGRALQGSFGYAAAAIAAGVAPPAQARSLWQRLSASRVSRDYSSQIAERYLDPFARELGLAGEALDAFRAEAVDACFSLARDKEKLFPAGEFPEIDLAGLLQTPFSPEITDLVTDRLGTLEPPELRDFLAYRGLLGDAVLYFFRETLRRDDRVAKTLSALQTEGLWADLRDVKAAQQRIEAALGAQLAEVQARLSQQHQAVIQATQAGDYDALPALGQTLSALKTESAALQARLSDLPERLQQAEAAWHGVDGRLAEFGQRLGDLRDLIQVGFDQVLGGIEALGGQVEHVDRRVGQVLERLEGLMQHLGLEDRVKPRDEFSQHNDRSLKLIAQALKEIERVPHSARGYSVAAIHMGSVLSSAGNLERAEQLFEQARDSARRPDEQALASFNLFQVRLRRKAYPEALAALEAAVAIDAARYALHNTAKYPVERILGAGGMGVAFLCRDRLRGHVVVKAFWEAAKGPIEEVFREVLILRDVAGRYVPAPYDYDYADPARQERPYIVTEYIEGAMDGEAWLAAHGRLDLAQGLQVGIEVARGLAAAHQAGVCHLDLKPANLLLEQTDQGIAVRIIDFGLARAVSSLRQDAAAQRSRSGKSLLAQEVFGTLEYAPPEQLGEVRYGPPGPKSDLYAFGATLYRLMTRRSPRALNRRALPPHSPEALYDLLCECVQEDPGHRPASASEVLQRLEALPRNRVYAPLEVLRDSLKDRTEGPEMVMIPPGRFVMGSPPSEEGRYDSEGPQHEVAIAQAFALGRFAVTVGDFRRFVQASGYKTEAETQGGSHVWDGKEWKLDKDRNWRSPGFEQGDDHPVVCVSWNDAQAYVRWLSEQTGERYRLPSEAEWEYACRAGTTRSRYWGDDPAQACRYGNVADKTAKRQFLGWEVHPCEDGYVYTAPVGKFQPNDFTLCDMLGNVWEWVEDCWHDSYNGAPADGSPWTSGGDRARRVFRGGSWGGEPRDVRSACRVGDGAGARSHYRGFRLARTL